MGLPAHVCSVESVLDMDEISEKFQNPDNSEEKIITINNTQGSQKRYEERMTGVFVDMFELGYV